LKANKRADGTWRVVLRLTHNRQSRYINTHFYVGPEDIVNGDDLSVDFIIDYLSDEIKKYRKKLREIEDIDLKTAVDIRQIITNDRKDVDFIEFLQMHTDRLISENREKTSRSFKTVRNSLIDYHGQVLYASQITSKFLQKYEAWLTSPRTITRQVKGTSITREVVMSEKGLHNHMSSLRTAFNAAKEHYNDEDTGNIIIKNNPFSKYKIKPKKHKKHKNLTTETNREIRVFESKKEIEKFGKNMFLLSFYLTRSTFSEIGIRLRNCRAE